MKKLSLIALSSLFFAGCALLPAKQSQQQTQYPTPPAQQSQTSPSTQVEQKKEVKADRVVEVIGKSFTYNQKEIRVKKGESVAVNFTSMEGLHDFVIDELNVRTSKLKDDASEMVMIPTDKPGKYAFYCSVGQHRQMGMEGTLIVEE